MPSWTPEQKQILTDHWRTHSASIIGAMLTPPATRSAVIGQAHRMGLVPKLRGAPNKRKAPRPKIFTPKRTTAFVPPLPELPVQPPAASATFDQDIPRSQLLRLEQLTPNSCRWPIDNLAPRAKFSFFFCGAAAPDQPYCAHHTAIAGRASTYKLV